MGLRARTISLFTIAFVLSVHSLGLTGISSRSAADILWSAPIIGMEMDNTFGGIMYRSMLEKGAGRCAVYAKPCT